MRSLFWVAESLLFIIFVLRGTKQRAAWGLFYKDTNPIHGGFTLMTESTPKSLTSSATITLGLRISTYEFCRDANIQFITATEKAYYAL